MGEITLQQGFNENPAERSAPNHFSAKETALRTENLSKNYGGNRGVIELNLEIFTGEIFGFLGPSGAGKSTTIRMLLDLIKPTGGYAFIFGLDSKRDSVEIKKVTGYLPSEFTLYANLTGAQILEYFSNLRGINNKQSREFIKQLAERLSLDLAKKFKHYSHGNKQKVGIIQALMHHPRLLVLDEPTTGLDPLNQQEFYKLILEAQKEGTTVFLSSHIMSEVEKVCDRVAIIREGRLVKVGYLDQLKGLKVHYLEITFRGEVPAQEFRNLKGLDHFEEERGEGRVTLRFSATPEILGQIIKIAALYPVENIISREPTLEESFLDFYKNQNAAR